MLLLQKLQTKVFIGDAEHGRLENVGFSGNMLHGTAFGWLLNSEPTP
jgi:hypothetical protein